MKNLALAASLAALPIPLHAQTAPPGPGSTEADGKTLPQRFGDLGRASLTHDELGARVMEDPRPGRFLRLLEGVRFDFAAREADSDGDLVLGLGFDAVKVLSTSEEDPSA